MQYPLYDYYYASDLTLEEILKHYIEKFYLRKHGRDKVDTVLNKVSNSSKITGLFELSRKKRIAPNYIDFGSTINEMMYFMFQSNSTQALAVLAAAVDWNKQINRQLVLKNEKTVRDDAIKIFKKYSIYEEMTQIEYKKMTDPIIDFHKSDDEIIEEKLTAVYGSNWEDPDFQNSIITILAEGGTEKQIIEKMSCFLGGKEKSRNYVELEEKIRKEIRGLFDAVGKEILKDSSSFDLTHKIKATTILSKLNADLENNHISTIDDIINSANEMGISWKIIKDEEFKRALAIYRDGK